MPTVKGTSSFIIQATDAFSTGNFVDRKSYTLTLAELALGNGVPGASVALNLPTPLVYLDEPSPHTIFARALSAGIVGDDVKQL